MLAAKDSEQNFIAKYLQNGDDDIMYKALKIVLKVCIGLSPTSRCACRAYNQNHQLSWWYALCLEGINTGSPTRALNEIYIRIKYTGYC